MKTIYQDDYQKIISVLIKNRKDKRMTQSQVAHKLNKPQSYIAKIEGHERKLDVLEFINLCKVLGISASELIASLE